MGRLTFDGNFCDIAMCQELPCKYPETGCTQKQVWERLKQYEDTGLEPGEVVALQGEVKTAYDENGIAYASEYTGYEAQHIIELIQAEKDGRLVVLPCKVGDPVHWVHNGTITNCKISRIQINRNGIYIFLRGKGNHGAFHIDTIGKTVFLTLEEAEAALEAQKGGDER